MSRRLARGIRLFGALALAAGTTLIVAAPAHAGEPDAIIRGAHFSPTTPGVDVYLGSFSGGSSRLWLNAVTYGTVSGYERITPGLYTVSMRVAGAPSTAPAVLSWTLSARAGQAYTVAGVGAGASVRGIVIDDDLTPPPPGDGRVRVIQAASRAPVVTISAVRGPVIARDAAFATTTPYASVPAGRWDLSAVSTGASAVSTSSSVAVEAGVSTSVLLLDAKSAGITLRTVLDSASAGTAPIGSVPAGGGGTAARPGAETVDLVGIGPLTVGVGIAAVGSLALAVSVTRTRRLRRNHSTVSERHLSSGGRHALG